MQLFKSKWQYLGILFCFSVVHSAGVYGQQSAVLIANSDAGSVVRFNGVSGDYEGRFVVPGSGGLGSGCLTAPTSLLIGPDGHLYVASGGGTDVVLRYDGQTGAFMNVFVSDGAGGLDEPSGMIFGPDGNLYVSSKETDEVLRYNGATGAFIDAFASTGSGGLDEPFGLTFGPDGNLYVNSVLTETIIRYHGATGAFIDVFADDSVIDFFENIALVFGPDGHLYVTSAHPGKVVRFDGTTGAAIDEFVAPGAGGMVDPISLRFGSDGDLYVLDYAEDNILRFDGSTGNFVEAFVAEGSGGLRCPYDFIFTTLPAPSCPATWPPNVDPVSPTKNRYLSFTDGNPGELTAIRVTFVSLPPPFDGLNGAQAYVGEPRQFCESSQQGAAVLPENCGPAPGLASRTFTGATFSCQPHYADWSQYDTVHVFDDSSTGSVVFPAATYDAQAIALGCPVAVEANYSAPLTINTSRWGDFVKDCTTSPCGPSDGDTDFDDIAAIVDKFRDLPGAPMKSRTDIGPGMVDQIVDFVDIPLAVDAFLVLPYPFPGPLTDPCN